MALSPEHRDKLEQLWAVTASDSAAKRERDERLLRENGWNVQATVEQIFTVGPDEPTAAQAGPSRPAPRPPRDDTPPIARAGTDTPPGARRLSGTARRPGRTHDTGLSPSAFFWPVTTLVSILTGAWYLFIRTLVPLALLPHLPRFLLPPPPSSRAGGPGTHAASRDPAAAAQRYVRDLELLCAAGASPPDLWVGTYRDFVADVRAQCRVGLVVLTCGEHDDDEAFRRDVLCDPELVKALRDNDVLVWGADVREREGYQVAQTLLVTTYPTLVFLSLLPVQHSATPKLSIITTLAGPPSTTTSTPAIVQTLTTTVLPRANALLARLRRERAALEESRHLREQQDRAFRAAEARDREKLEASRRAAELQRVKAERAAREAEREARRVADRRAWRRYARKHLLPRPALAAAGGGGALRVAVRTPLSADRHVRVFAPGPSTMPLFVFAETLLIAPGDTPDTDPDEPPAGYEHAWQLRLVTMFPRKEIELVDDDAGGAAAMWDAVRQAGGALVAEKIEGTDWGDAELRALHGDSDNDDDDDVVSE